ncbi:lantibiotic dehydratase family protein [Flavobacterium sp.]|uniref:lantibiotic dehydratase family protein n=1 Tax=Flavobacterium sp. TaxID=239 RepID=UPI003D11B736
MTQPETNFDFFSSFIIRVPSFPFSFFQNLTNGTIIDDYSIKELLNDNQIKESLFLASPELYNEVEKWISSENYAADKARKIKISILKYFIRMSTRCTPFGLFSGCGFGEFDSKTTINIDNSKSFYRRTRFDMQFIVNLGNELQANSIIQNKLLFYPNTTLYKLGEGYRYIQYTLDQNIRKYSLEAVKRTPYLDLVLENSFLGISKIKLANLLISDEISEIEAIEYLEELISHQILISELELTLTGDEFFNTLNDLTNGYQELNSNKEQNQLITNNPDKNNLRLDFNALSEELLKIDTLQEATILHYKKIVQNLRNTNLLFSEKYLFQTDLFLNSDDFQLDENYKNELLNAIELLNKISRTPQKTNLEKFKQNFKKRYDTEFIPLVKALDLETGIGYASNNENFDVTPLLDKIDICKIKNEGQVILDEIEKIIHHKLKNAILNNENNVQLSNKDFSGIDFSNENLSTTFSCLFEIVKENEKQWIVIQNIGGSSAANLFARFCYGNNDINELANQITKYESDILEDKIVAEIIHLPEARTGNVLRRPTFRSFEIPYLAKSNLESSKQIAISDIILKISSDRLILWSKKYNKEIIPKLTNAHNFSNKSLPIYQFLCDMQFENCRPNLGIKTDNLEKLFSYFPRITIGKCIISKARWIYTQEQNPELFKKLNSKHKLYDENILSLISDISPFEKENSLPQYVSLLDGDNTLLINMQNSTCVEILLSTIKNQTKFVLEEYLFPSEKIVTTENDYYANQFIVGLKLKEKELKNE